MHKRHGGLGMQTSVRDIQLNHQKGNLCTTCVADLIYKIRGVFGKRHSLEMGNKSSDCDILLSLSLFLEFLLLIAIFLSLSF